MPDQGNPRLGPSGASTSPESGFAVSTFVNFLSREKTQNMVDIFALHLFVVVFLLRNCHRFNTFGFLQPRATLLASNFMMKRTLPLLILFSFLVAQLSAQTQTSAPAQPPAPGATKPAYGEKLHIVGIHNAGKISAVLYRGAQPQEQGLSELKKLGITTIVDLRGEDREKIKWERKHAESLGLRFVNIPVSGWSPPTNEQVVQFLSLLRGDSPQIIFVHCRFGDDRTGVFVATYRMAFEKWTANQAMNEMYFFGFNGFWHPVMKSFIRNFPTRLNSQPALASLVKTSTQP
jgi:tyrosine-protein phosphatase SIW14